MVMALPTLPDRSDKFASTDDWRTGVVELSADHVFGATALTAQEWAALPQRKGAEYFLIERTALLGREIAGITFSSRPDAYDHMHHAIELTPEAFVPFGPFRLVVREAER
jgi:hypothetical protein